MGGGGGSKKQTVGYKYYLGMHKILCHGPIDRISKIFIDKKQAWVGDGTGGSIYIYKPNLFGGERREGGVVGSVDIQMGRSNQGVNSYLAQRLGANVPAFRNVVGVVLRQVYLGMNPYLKPWSFLATRVNTLSNGDTQWYPNRASINTTGIINYGTDPIYLFFGIDKSGSMTHNNRIGMVKSAMTEIFDEIQLAINKNANISIRIDAWGSTSSVFTRYNINTASLNEVRNFVNNINANEGSTNFTLPVNTALTFFRTDIPVANLFFFVTDGAPHSGSDDTAASLASDMLDRTSGDYSTQSGTAVDMYGINIDRTNISATAKLDNTPEDGVPVITFDNTSGFVNVITQALKNIQVGTDANPAHIIRECLTDNIWGMGYQASDVDDDSFTQAAEQLWQEGFGISLLWDAQTTIEDFIGEVLKHIDASVRVNPRSGKFELKLIRDDFVKESLMVLNASNISKIENYSKKSLGELVNTVTVQYWDGTSLTDASVTLHDLALIQVQGASVNTTLQYPGITSRNLASRVAQRDLKSLSVPLVSCKITAVGDALDLTVGDVFTLNWPVYNIAEMVMRVSQVTYSDDKTHSVEIQCSQDTYALPTLAFVPAEDTVWEDATQPPLPVERRYIYEMPYYEMVKFSGQSTVDNELEYNNYGSILAVSASAIQDGSFNADFHVNMGVGMKEEGSLEYAPSVLLEIDIYPWDETISFTSPVDIDTIGDSSWGVINDELIAIDSYDTETNTIYIRRGMFDTVPQKHLANSILMVTEDFIGTNNYQYVEGDILDVAITPTTGAGTLDIADTYVDTITLVGRPYRPYRPGNVRLNNYLWPEEHAINYPATLTWSHRNRVAQTAPIFTNWDDGDVTPEVGTEYNLVIDGLDSDAAFIENVVNVTTALTTYEITALQAAYEKLRITLSTVRGTFVSYQSVSYVVNGFITAPYNVVGTYKAPEEPTLLTAEQL